MTPPTTTLAIAIAIELPAQSDLEISGSDVDATQEQFDEELAFRQAFLDEISPYLASLPERPPHRMGNVSRAELLGTDIWTQMNHYLLLLSADIGQPTLDLEAHMPAGSTVMQIGSYRPQVEFPLVAAGHYQQLAPHGTRRAQTATRAPVRRPTRPVPGGGDAPGRAGRRAPPGA